MFLAGLVVTEKLALEDVLEEFVRDDADALRIRAGAARGEFQDVVGGAGVAVGEGSDAEEDLIVGVEIFVCETALLVGEGAAKKFDDKRSGERVENVDLGAGEKRRDDLEGRILGCGANEGDVARLDAGRK